MAISPMRASRWVSKYDFSSMLAACAGEKLGSQVGFKLRRVARSRRGIGSWRRLGMVGSVDLGWGHALRLPSLPRSPDYSGYSKGYRGSG